VLQPEGIADRQDFLSDLQRGGIAQRQDGQRFGRGFDLQHRQVGLRIGANQLRRPLAPVGEAHLQPLGSLHDMVVGQDVPAGIEDETGP